VGTASTRVILRNGVGAYPTPDKLARFLVSWAIRGVADTMMDPCCGDGVFLEAAADRFAFLGAHDEAIKQITGVELDSETAKQAVERLHGKYGISPNIISQGFFKTLQTLHGESFDVVAGNPPFVRYRNFLPEEERDRALRTSVSNRQS